MPFFQGPQNGRGNQYENKIVKLDLVRKIQLRNSTGTGILLALSKAGAE